MAFRNRALPGLAAATLLLAALAGCGSGPGSAPGGSPAAPGVGVSRLELEPAITLAAGYMVRHCDAEGRFLYRTGVEQNVPAGPKAQASGSYNILRHAGALYALCMYEGRSPNDATRQAIARAARFLRLKAIAPVEGKPGLLAVWSLPEFGETRDRRRQAKLGGAGLALVALSSAEKALPGTTNLGELQGLGRFVLYMQKLDGSFYCKYIPDAGGRNDEWTSLYYPGEAALGLAFLYERDRRPEWLQGAAKAMGFLARLRAGRPAVEPDHWALLCTARLLPFLEQCPAPAPARADLVRHAAQICESLLAAAGRFPADAPEHGSLTGQGLPCQTATRLEGLLGALTFLPVAYSDLRNRVSAATHPGVRFLLRAQIRSGEFAGGIPRAIGPPRRDVPLPATGQKPGAGEEEAQDPFEPIRIDYVQHVLSALIQYEQLFVGPPTGKGRTVTP